MSDRRKGKHATGPLSPDQRAVVETCRRIVQAHQRGGAEAVAALVPTPPPIPGQAGLNGYAYRITVDQLRRLLEVTDALAGGS